MMAIPLFPEYKRISLEDRETVQKYLSMTRQEMSECTFSGLYIWQNSFEIGLSHIDSALLVRTFYPDGRQSCMMPFGATDPVAVVKDMCNILKESKITHPAAGSKEMLQKPELYFISHPYGKTDTDAESPDLAKGLETAGFQVAQDRDNWDYVYLVKDLTALEGTKYHSKKKAMNKCLSHYRCEFEEMTMKNIEECIDFQTEWCRMMRCSEDPSLVGENLATDIALQEFHKLGFIGGVVRIDGKIQAITLGERLNDSTAVVHFEKANPAIDGLYQVINNWFCANTLKEYEFVNREQDLGKPGLRKAKESYRPHHMVEKYVARMKEYVMQSAAASSQ